MMDPDTLYKIYLDDLSYYKDQGLARDEVERRFLVLKHPPTTDEEMRHNQTTYSLAYMWNWIEDYEAHGWRVGCNGDL